MDDLIEAIVDPYFKVNCAIFTPNPDRLDHIIEMVETYQAGDVIHYALQFCRPYLMESMPVKRALKQRYPPLRVETDYSMEDMGQLKTRVEAFIELIK